MLRHVVARTARRAASGLAPGLATGAARRASSLADVSLELYHDMANLTIEGVQEVYEDYSDATPDQQVEVECASDVLNVTVGAHGTFVLNKQAPNKQLWLSSPVSGPLRYDFCPESAAWLNSRDRHPLLPLLVADFEALVGDRLDFAPVEEALGEALAESRF